MSELRRCPFCGERDDMLGFMRTPYAWAVACLVCQAVGPLTFPKAKAIAAWNRREPDWERKWEGLVETVGARIAQDDAQKKGAK